MRQCDTCLFGHEPIGSVYCKNCDMSTDDFSNWESKIAAEITVDAKPFLRMIGKVQNSLKDTEIKNVRLRFMMREPAGYCLWFAAMLVGIIVLAATAGIWAAL